MAWSDAARQASAEARRASAKAKKEPTVENHETASRAHTNAENKNRDAVAKIRQSDAEGDLGLHETAVAHHDKMSAQHQVAAEKLKDDVKTLSGKEPTKGQKLDSEINTKTASFNASKATATARASGKAEDHDRAAKAHVDAAVTHQDAHGAITAKVDHHQKMANMHEEKAEKIRKDDEDRKAPKGVGKLWNS